MYNRPDILVDLPNEKGIFIKKISSQDSEYVYKRIRYYRDSMGRARSDTVLLGKYDPKTKKMIPNKNYYKMYPSEESGNVISVESYGYSYVINKCIKELKLDNCLKSVFDKMTENIITLASYILANGNVIDGLDQWLLHTYNKSSKLTSKVASKIFASIDFSDQFKFFKEWVAGSYTGGSVCYDVTSISSYSTELISVEPGYNRDGEKLPQFNIGIFCDENNKLPLYHVRYSGSITDRTNLEYALKNANSIGIKDIKLIIDGGFWSKEAILNLNDMSLTFTMGMPTYLKAAKEMMNKYQKTIIRYENHLQSNYYCIGEDAIINGIKGKILLYSNLLNQAEQTTHMYQRINKLTSELETKKKFPENRLSRYTQYYKIYKTDTGFSYEINPSKIDDFCEKSALFLLFTTDMTADYDELLNHYRSKDICEKAFEEIKVYMNGNRIRTHNENTTEGKIFITFISTILRTYILNKTAPYLRKKSMSLNKLLANLSNISIIKEDNQISRLKQALTKTQKEILNLFDIKEADLLCEIL